LQKFTEAP